MKNFLIAHDDLSNSGHTGPMETPKPARSVLLVLGVLMLAAWALVLWVAMRVTHTMLDVLSYVVELAQMT